jgi:hypothetical protein
MDAIKLPLKFVDGSADVWADQTDQYFAHLLFCFASTRRGELVLMPQVGVGDIPFDVKSIESLSYNVAQFIPEIDIADLEAYASDSGQTEIKLSFLKRD